MLHLTITKTIDGLIKQKEEIDSTKSTLEKQKENLLNKSKKYSEEQKKLSEEYEKFLSMQNEYGVSIANLESNKDELQSEINKIMQEYEAKQTTTASNTTKATTSVTAKTSSNSNKPKKTTTTKKAVTTKKETTTAPKTTTKKTTTNAPDPSRLLRLQQVIMIARSIFLCQQQKAWLAVHMFGAVQVLMQRTVQV